MKTITTLEEAREVIAELMKLNDGALAQIDKLTILNGAVLMAISQQGLLTYEQYTEISARMLVEWTAKQKRHHA